MFLRSVALLLTAALPVAVLSVRDDHAPAPVSPETRLVSAVAVPGTTEVDTVRAAALVRRMSLPEVAGQVIVAGYPGTGSPAALVGRLHLGGVVPVAVNITSPAQIRAVNDSVRRVVAGRGYPAFIGVDQEGGLVARVHAPATAFPTFMSTGAGRRTDLTRSAAAASAAEMATLGFTSVLGPDADVTRGPSDPVIGTRSAGGHPAAVARQVVAADEGVRDVGMVGALKHFPGHGSLTSDSHLSLPVQRRSLAQLMATDLVPFWAAIAGGANVVMTGHIDVRAVDPGVPASVSRKVTTGLLRQRLGFRGLVVTDGLGMLGVARRYPSSVVGARALWAGADVVLMPPDPSAARDGIVRAVRRGTLSRERLDEAATRMIALLLHQQPLLQPRALGTGRAASTRLSAAALTSVSGRCHGRLVGRAVHVAGPTSVAATFRRIAAANGLPSTRRGTTVVLARTRPVRGAVVVALDRPNLLGHSRAPVRLAAYGETPEAMTAVVRFLLGRAAAPGRLPVPVAGAPRGGC